MMTTDGVKLQDAISTLSKALREDRELYDTYQANIAMAVYDAYDPKSMKLSKRTLHEIANLGARNFLDLLIR